MLNLLDEFVTGWVDDPLAGFAVGTFGAIAEFLRPPGATVTVEHRPGRHTAVCDDGALRLDLQHGALTPRAWRRPTGTDDWTHAVALCLPTDRAAGPSRAAVTVLGDDPDPLVAPGTLIDLGLGVAHLEACIRTSDRALVDRCEEASALDGELVGAIVGSGATRVFRTAVARIEVCTPIPPPDGDSPLGPHTHLLPALLAHRRTHAATDPIPDGEVPVASVFPNHPRRDALGRPHPYDADADAAFEAVLEAFGDPDELSAARAGGPAPAVANAAERRGHRVGERMRASAAHEIRPGA
ncbi:hypothetical protein WCD74_09775 [Actinomycetospora sp. OC33-EN08]|uniref:Uncharacterized protein n=1 Tax=Actinomycetospora aurantiaca TaxID=3129233 RepID=A0ABU8ML62_9PSEU